MTHCATCGCARAATPAAPLVAAAQAVVDSWDCILPLSYGEQEVVAARITELAAAIKRAATPAAPISDDVLVIEADEAGYAVLPDGTHFPAGRGHSVTVHRKAAPPAPERSGLDVEPPSGSLPEGIVIPLDGLEARARANFIAPSLEGLQTLVVDLLNALRAAAYDAEDPAARETKP